MATRAPNTPQTENPTEGQNPDPNVAQKAESTPKKPKWTPEELLVIFDEMIFSGEYVEDVTVRGKLKVTFRSRSAEDISAISRELDGKNYTLINTMQEERALLNLAYSLVAYSGRDLKNTTIEERRKLVARLPAVMVEALSNALYQFDQKIAAACEEGESNF